VKAFIVPALKRNVVTDNVPVRSVVVLDASAAFASGRLSLHATAIAASTSAAAYVP
jgi:hypothetical protein